MNDELCACAHTKIKEIRWNENLGQSSKFMCLDCNTDFVPLTGEIRDFIWRKKNLKVDGKDSGGMICKPDPNTYTINNSTIDRKSNG